MLLLSPQGIGRMMEMAPAGVFGYLYTFFNFEGFCRLEVGPRPLQGPTVPTDLVRGCAVEDLELRRDFDMGIRTRSEPLGTAEFAYIERQHGAP